MQNSCRAEGAVVDLTLLTKTGGGGKPTLTDLYNQRPTWLELTHKKLDQAVFAAYG